MGVQIMPGVMQAKRREISTEIKYDMSWEMNHRCNFNCVYCFRKHPDEDRRTEDPACARYSAEHIAQRFDETGKPWRIRLSGGEPLMYPGFLELAALLTRTNYIYVNTNLSTPNAYDFADAVKPDRVARIYASLHILEREKSPNGVRDFLRKFLFFQERGFDINLVYVAYPPLLERISRDITWWRCQGVRRIVIKMFQGKFEGKHYPRDYTDVETSLLKWLRLDYSEEEILARRVSFLGRKCQAGHRAFAMDISGNVKRCNSLKEGYGNLFEGTFRPGRFTRRCTARRCLCTNEGVRFSSSRGSATPSRKLVKPARFIVAVGERFTGLKRINPFL
jgi:hypothetical protein